MRTLLQVSMDVEAANDSIISGKMQQTMNAVLKKLNPEAVYFTAIRGKRTALIFFDLKDPSMIPQIAEPLFSVFKAEIDFYPAMNQDDLMKGLQSWDASRKAA